MKSATFIRSTEKDGEHHIEVVEADGLVMKFTEVESRVLTQTVGPEMSNLIKSALIDWQNWVDKHEN